MIPVYIGIDGGGTRTTAAAALPDGTIVGTAAGEGLNYYIDGMDVCLRRFRKLVDELLSPLSFDRAAVCAGLSALDEPAGPEVISAFQRALPENCSLDLQNDVYIALMGHTKGLPGLMAICGTGSMLLALDGQGRQHIAGGWGWKFHDAGSGYSLAREGMMRALDRWEETGEESPLLRAAMAFFGASSPRGIIAPVYDADCVPDQLARFGAEILRLAEEKDLDALDVVSREMERLARQAAGLLGRVPESESRVCLYGGVFQHSAIARYAFADHLHALAPKASFSAPRYAPPIGAIIHMMLKNGVSPADIPDFKEAKE